jgi:hypothetical protein
MEDQLFKIIVAIIGILLLKKIIEFCTDLFFGDSWIKYPIAIFVFLLVLGLFASSNRNI